MDKREIAVIACLVLLCVLSFGAGYLYILPGVQEQKAKTNSLELSCSVDALAWSRNNTYIAGVAQGDVFCVTAKDRDIVDVLNACAHEWAHVHEGMRDKE